MINWFKFPQFFPPIKKLTPSEYFWEPFVSKANFEEDPSTPCLLDKLLQDIDHNFLNWNQLPAYIKGYHGTSLINHTLKTTIQWYQLQPVEPFMVEDDFDTPFENYKNKAPSVFKGDIIIKEVEFPINNISVQKVILKWEEVQEKQLLKKRQDILKEFGCS
jgi:hypothetical protein